MAFWLLKKSKKHKFIIMRKAESNILIIAIALGLLFIHMQANQAVGRNDYQCGADGFFHG